MNSLTAKGSKIRVLIVDDSAVVRRCLTELLRAAGFDVVGGAQDPLFAMDLLRRQPVDVITLDVEMPRMDGVTFLRHLMSTQPIPVVMCSTLTEKGAQTTMAALSAGAVSIVTKPKTGLKEFLSGDGNGIVAAVRAAARANLRAVAPLPAQGGASAATPLAPMLAMTDRVVVIGVSTGGVQAIERILPRLPHNAPGMVIVQHMPERFTASLAERLNGLCEISVREARSGDRVLPGVALIAPGGRHTKLVRSGAQVHVEVFDGPVVNHHRPSVDVLFRSATAAIGRHAIGVIMTGMGDDGARGMKELHDAGAFTLAQDEASCTVFGMPKEAIRLGGVSAIVPLEDMAHQILKAAASPHARS